MNAGSTTSRIFDAARRLLEKEGAEAVTMRRVAAAVGVTAMAVYRHYSDRADLLNALANAGFAELAARLERAPAGGDFESRLEGTLDIFLRHGLENPRLFELMFLRPRKGARRYPGDFQAGYSPTANLAMHLIREGMENGYFRADDAWEISFEMGALLQGLIMLYLGGRIDMAEARFRALCHRSLRRYINGVRN